MFGTNGEFIVKDASTTFLTLSQDGGLIKLPYSLGSTNGLIFKGTDRFLHIDYKRSLPKFTLHYFISSVTVWTVTFRIDGRTKTSYLLSLKLVRRISRSDSMS